VAPSGNWVGSEIDGGHYKSSSGPRFRRQASVPGPPKRAPISGARLAAPFVRSPTQRPARVRPGVSEREMSAASICDHQRAARRELTGRSEGRTRCNIAIIWDYCALGLSRATSQQPPQFCGRIISPETATWSHSVGSPPSVCLGPQLRRKRGFRRRWYSGASRGGTRRAHSLALIMVPPRHLKSHLASIAFPAWCLGHDPGDGARR
jgi:hypothetical protein